MLGIFGRTYRKLRKRDLPAARAHLERLDADDQFHHFHRLMEPEDFDAWARRARHHRLIGCFERRRLIGLAEFVVEEREAEMTLSVDADRRGRGIGTTLFEKGAREARKLGATHLSILITRGDNRMLDLAVRHNGFTAFRGGESRLVPGEFHNSLRWIIFDLEAGRRGPVARLVARVREALGLSPPRHTPDLASWD